MRNPGDIRQLMPLMREFGELARKRVGVGVTPLEYQRYLDLRGRIGKCFTDKGSIQSQGGKRRAGQSNLTRLAVSYPNRAALVSCIIDNIKPAGIMVCTPFAADVGTHFLLRISLEHEEEAAEFPAVVVTSMTQGAPTLSTTSMGMSLKIEKMNRAQRAGLSKLFANELDRQLGWVD